MQIYFNIIYVLFQSEMEEEAEDDRRRKRLEEARRRLNNDEMEEAPGDEQTSPSDSQTSSVEGLYGAISGKNSHPFKVVDHDSVSLQSGVSSGRVPRLGNPGSALSSVNNFNFSGNNNSSSHYLSSQSHVPSSPSISSASPSSPSPSSNSNATLVQHPGIMLNHNNPSDNGGVQVPLSLNNSSPQNISPNPDSQTIVGNGNLTRSGNSNPKNFMAPEPDLVVSCLPKDVPPRPPPPVLSKGLSLPVAPPRRRKRVGLEKTMSEEGESSRDVTPLRENPPFPFPNIDSFSYPRPPTSISSSSRCDSSSSMSTVASPNPPSPTVSIRSVCRELDKTLETSSQQRIYVVKAQDEEKTRAKNSGPKALRRTESLPKDPSGSLGSHGHKFPNISSAPTNAPAATAINSSTSNLNSNSNNDSGDPPPSATAVSAIIMQNAIQNAIQDKRHSLSSSSEKSVKLGGPNSRSNSAPKTGSIQLSSLVSAMAAMEDRKDTDGSGALAQFNMIRTRTDSGKLLSDIEILEQVQVTRKNLMFCLKA